MKWLARLLATLLLASVCSGDNIVYVRIHRPVIQAELKMEPATETDRPSTLRALFAKAGCGQIQEQPVPNEDLPNLLCIVPGTEAGTIVVGASFDYPAAKFAPSSGWGALLDLPLLAESVGGVQHRLTLVFAAFAGKPRPSHGATWYVEHLPEERRKSIRALIDLDDLGRTPPVFALASTDRALVAWLDVAALTLRFQTPPRIDAASTIWHSSPERHATRDEELWANARPFVAAQVPAISFRSAPDDSLPVLHRAAAFSETVTGTDFNLDNYEDTYQLLCIYLLYLDRNLGKPLVEPGIYSAKVVNTQDAGDSSPIDLSLQINNFTTSGQLNRYELVLHKGQDALADVLLAETQIGMFRFGLNLALGANLISLRQSAHSNEVLLVGVRAKGHDDSPRDYRFCVVRLNLDAQGRGDGDFYSSAKLHFNKKHELEVEDFGSAPGRVTQVRFQPAARENRTTVLADAGHAAPAGSADKSTVVPAPIPATAHTTAASAAADVPAAASVPAATNPSSAKDTSDPPPVFRAKARLVLLDVTVTDGQGHPVENLPQSDFTVLENGKPQTIQVFEPHFPATNQSASAMATAPAPSLPPHTFTNRVAPAAEQTSAILLLDLLNTPVLDQAYARKQTIRFLKSTPPGQRIAIYVLSQRLVLVQDFTSDPTLLVAAAEQALNEKSLFLTTESERQVFQGTTENVGTNATPVATGQGQQSLTLPLGSMDLGSAQARTNNNAAMEGSRTGLRINSTLDGLTALAGAVSFYPGRKNLVWLSGSFPIRLKPTDADLSRTAVAGVAPGSPNNQDFVTAVRQVASALAAARIAVYPIDVRGVQTSGVDPTLGAAESASFTSPGNPTTYGTLLNAQSETRFSERTSMLEVAQQTGGEVLAGNDIRSAIAKGLERGSSYYTLAYVPEKEDSNPTFRKVTVQLKRNGLTLGYRPGYFPVKSDQNHPLVAAMQPGMLPLSAIPLTVVVLPPDAVNRLARIDYSIQIGGIDFPETDDHRRHVVFDCIAVAFSKEGRMVGQVSNTIDATLSPADYTSALKDGFAVHQEIDLPSGSYTFRLGVLDHASQRIGTLDASVVVPAVAAVK
jgi:VWFA-related protein